MIIGCAGTEVETPSDGGLDAADSGEDVTTAGAAIPKDGEGKGWCEGGEGAGIEVEDPEGPARGACGGIEVGAGC